MAKKKLLQTFCLGAAMLSTGMAAEADIINEPIEMQLSDAEDLHKEEKNDLNISTTGGSYNAAVALKALGSNSTYTLDLKGNVSIDVGKDARALYAVGEWNSRFKTFYSGIINVNPDGDKTVKITGDAEAGDYGEINLNLTNADSYLAGTLKTTGTDSAITLKLNNGAAWYVSPEDDYYLNPSGNYNTTLNLSGGIVDLYHTAPGATTRNNAAADFRNFQMHEYKGSNLELDKTTFRIKSDIKNGRADKITVYSPTGWNGKGNTETLYVQVAYDPSLTTTQVLTATQDIPVVDVTGVKGDKFTVEGKAYTQDAAAGLTTLTITPTLTKDTIQDIWNLTELTAVAENTGTEESGTQGSSAGPAMQMAESAALSASGMLSAARADNNDLMRRMGDLRNCNDEVGFWLRYYTGNLEAGSGSELKYKALQGGYDRQYRLGKGSLFAGVTLSHTDGDLSWLNGGGETDSTLVGLYGSYLGDKGHFADFILKYGHQSSDFASLVRGNHYQGDISSRVFSLSAEYGYHKALNQNWYIEPQAELTYGYVSSDDYTMRLNGGPGARIENDSLNSLTGRLGFTLGQKSERGSFYAKLSLVREFAGDLELRAEYKDEKRSYSQSMKDTWIEYGLGFNAKLRPDLNLYGELEKSTGDKIENKWRANLGLRYVF